MTCMIESSVSSTNSKVTYVTVRWSIAINSIANCRFRSTIRANVRNGAKPHITVLREQFLRQPKAGSASEFCLFKN